MWMNRVFKYDLPTSIEFGAGAVKLVGDRVRSLGGTKVMVVSDTGVLNAGLVDRVLKPLHEARLDTVLFTDVASDPSIESVDEGAALAKAEQCDAVVGIGGGSALDTAKAVGLMQRNTGNIRDYIGLNKVPHRGVPVIAIPTAAGTGSEVTIWSVLSDTAQHMKVSVGSVYNCPTLALCDPELTLTLPSNITAATGMDALTHALESYVNKATQPISECLARQAIEMIVGNLRVAVAQGDNLEARTNMQLASLIAAMAFNPTRLGLSHALAMPLGAQFHIPHGVVNAILLPEVMQFNLTGNLAKYAELGRIFHGNVQGTIGLSERELAEYAVTAVRQLNQDIGLTATLSDYGVHEEALTGVAEEAMDSGNVPVNPRKPTIEDFRQICRAAMRAAV